MYSRNCFFLWNLWKCETKNWKRKTREWDMELNLPLMELIQTHIYIFFCVKQTPENWIMWNEWQKKNSCPGYCPMSMWMLIKSVENSYAFCVTWNINNNKKNKEEIGKNIIFTHANILRIFLCAASSVNENICISS